MKRNNAIFCMVIMMITMLVINLYIAFSGVQSVNYFGFYEIRITPVFRLMCFLGGTLMSMIFLAMIIGTIVEKIKKNRAHSVNRMTDDEWNQFCSLGKVPPELMKKVENADEISMSELEHLSDKKD